MWKNFTNQFIPLPEEGVDFLIVLLKDTLTQKQVRRTQGNKIVAVSPFVATICFFISGFYFDGWQYGWLFFLMIPMLGILFNSPRRDRIVALAPFISVIAMMLIGFLTGYWEYAWLPFLSIPVLGYFTHGKKLDAWVFFMLIVLGIAGYVVFGQMYGFNVSWLSFAPAIIYSILRGDIAINFGNLKGQERRKTILFLGFSISMIALSYWLDIFITRGLGVGNLSYSSQWWRFRSLEKRTSSHLCLSSQSSFSIP